MTRLTIALAGLSAILALAPLPALADGWVVTSLQGAVLAVKDGGWVKLKLHDTLANAQLVRSLAFGRAQFSRNGETIDLLGNTQIAIADQAAGHFTSVRQYFGSITVEDNETAVPHFRVDTPYMTAVVKGTVFTVATHGQGTQTSVARGKVEVADPRSRRHALILPGQFAASGVGAPLTTGGSGALQPIVSASGVVVKASETSVAPASAASSDNAENGVHGNGRGKGESGSQGNLGDNGNHGDNRNSGNNGNGNGNSGNGNSNGNGNSSGDKGKGHGN